MSRLIRMDRTGHTKLASGAPATMPPQRGGDRSVPARAGRGDAGQRERPRRDGRGRARAAARRRAGGPAPADRGRLRPARMEARSGQRAGGVRDGALARAGRARRACGATGGAGRSWTRRRGAHVRRADRAAGRARAARGAAARDLPRRTGSPVLHMQAGRGARAMVPIGSERSASRRPRARMRAPRASRSDCSATWSGTTSASCCRGPGWRSSGGRSASGWSARRGR